MFDLTKQEKTVLVSFVLVCLVGLGVHYLFVAYPHIEQRINFLDNDHIFSPIDINKATRKQLTNLPSIGPALADRIIDYRRSNGSLKKISELRNIEGMTEGKYEKIKKFFKIGFF